MRKVSSFILMVFLFSIASFCLTPVLIDVGPEGSEYPALYDAVQTAKEGDTLLIHEGTYEIDNGLTIDKALNLKGEGQGKVIFKVSGKEPIKIIRTSIEETSISGITILSETYGLFVMEVEEGMGNVLMSDLTIVSDDTGILISGQGNTVENCKIKSGKNCIEIRSSYSHLKENSLPVTAKITGCYLEANSETHRYYKNMKGSGISLAGSGGIYLEGNEYENIIAKVIISGFWTILNDHF